MANGIIQGTGLMLGVLGSVIMVVAVMIPNWRQNDVSDDIIQAIRTHSGLWSKCVSYTTGQWQCDQYDNFLLGLPDRIKFARGFSMASIVFAVIALVTSFLAVKCISVMEDNLPAKQKIGYLAGIFWALAGIGIGTAASYFAFHIKREFEACRVFNPSSSSASFNSTLQRCHVFGPGIYIGWMAMFLLLCAGALMACGSHRVDEENKDSRVYRSYSRVKRNLSNRWQRSSRNEQQALNRDEYV